jgi:hypothetical protein
LFCLLQRYLKIRRWLIISLYVRFEVVTVVSDDDDDDGGGGGGGGGGGVLGCDTVDSYVYPV